MLCLPLFAYFYLTHLNVFFFSVKTHNTFVNINTLSQQSEFYSRIPLFSSHMYIFHLVCKHVY